MGGELNRSSSWFALSCFNNQSQSENLTLASATMWAKTGICHADFQGYSVHSGFCRLLGTRLRLVLSCSLPATPWDTKQINKQEDLCPALGRKAQSYQPQRQENIVGVTKLYLFFSLPTSPQPVFYCNSPIPHISFRSCVWSMILG